MTDLATAMAAVELGEFEGKSIRRAGIEISNAAGGLQKALHIEPRIFHQGDRVQVVLDCIVQKVRFDPVDKEEPWGDQERVHVMTCDGATFADSDEIREMLRLQAIRIKRADDAAHGRAKLPTDQEFMEAHENGEHDDGPVEGCAACAAIDEDGVVPFEALSDEKKALWIAHGNGKHASGPVEGCPSCDKPLVREPSEPTDIATAKGRGRSRRGSNGES